MASNQWYDSSVVTLGGTATYHGLTDLPPLVAAAAALAGRTGFDLSCLPAHGRLLSVLAAGRPGGRIGETGTGCGVGLAWLATGADPSARLVQRRGRPRAGRRYPRPVRRRPQRDGPDRGLERSCQAEGPFDLLGPRRGRRRQVG